MKKKGLYQETALEEGAGELPKDFKPNLFLAVIPLLPLIILLLGNFGYVKFLKMPVSHAMIIGAVIAMIATRTGPGSITKTFFKGMGDAFGSIFGIIIAANIFCGRAEILWHHQGTNRLYVRISNDCEGSIRSWSFLRSSSLWFWRSSFYRIQ